MQKNVVRLIQISDTHLFEDATRSFRGVQPNASFEAVLKLIEKNEPHADLVIHSGDMAQDEREATYHYVGKMIQATQFPFAYIPGNHDDYEAQLAIFPQYGINYQPCIEMGHWQIVILNSQKIGHIPGELTELQLSDLENHLQTDRFTLIVLHHNPVPTCGEAADDYMLQPAQPFLDIIAQYPNVKAVLFGHIHHEVHQRIGQVDFYGCPSTWVQFSPEPGLRLQPDPQGYRWLNLYEDGRLQTGITRLNEYYGEYIEYPEK